MDRIYTATSIHLDNKYPENHALSTIVTGWQRIAWFMIIFFTLFGTILLFKKQASLRIVKEKNTYKRDTDFQQIRLADYIHKEIYFNAIS
jgi:hypothetical protein